MLIEVIGTSVQDVIEAEKFGADRIELCQNMTEGGLTPSIGLVEAAVNAVNIPINVMVRPHSKSFVYTAEDLDVMEKDIHAIKKAGANGIVIGALTDKGVVDEGGLQRLLQAAEGLEVAFHRAFDEVQDQMEALETILTYEQINTILTSGGEAKATQAIPRLADLVRKTKNTSLTIMPGSGLHVKDIPAFHQSVQSDALHFGTGVRMDSSFNRSISEEKITMIREITG